MKKNKILNEDEVRKKVDGFSLEKKDNKEENCYTATDQGIYSSPDDKLNAINKKGTITNK